MSCYIIVRRLLFNGELEDRRVTLLLETFVVIDVCESRSGLGDGVSQLWLQTGHRDGTEPAKKSVSVYIIMTILLWKRDKHTPPLGEDGAAERGCKHQAG